MINVHGSMSFPTKRLHQNTKHGTGQFIPIHEWLEFMVNGSKYSLILVMSQLALGGNLQVSQFFQELAWKTGPTLVTEVVLNLELFFVSFYGGKNSVSFRDRRLVFHYCTSWYRKPAYKQRS